MTTAPEPFPDHLAAHDLLSDLRTRIATQPLPYQHGVEARALESLQEVFALARKAMKDHPGCERFARLTTTMLNVDLRPITAKWHRAHEAGLLDSKDGASEFRADLAAVRPKLVAFSESLQEMAYGTRVPDAVTPAVLDEKEIDRCFEPVPFGIGAAATIPIANAKEIDRLEAAEVVSRRRYYGIHNPCGTDAVGLALSGGGIRSATFCLGVVQVLAERGLMKDVDYLSTVSGGGYTGSFITARVGCDEDFAAIARPHGPDTEPVRHVRQNAKYLSAIDLKQRWSMVTGTMAGLLLNWTAPLSIVAALAWFGNWVRLSADAWLTATAVLAAATALGIILYGICLRVGAAGARAGGLVMSCGTALTVLAFVGFIIERGYVVFAATSSAPSWSIPAVTAAWAIAGPAIVRFLPIFRSPFVKRTLFKTAVLLAGIVAPVGAVACYYILRKLGSLPTCLAASEWNPLHYVDGASVLGAIAIASGLFSVFILDVNLTGLHKLYRDRLAATFVQATTGAPDLPLGAVDAAHRAPYHLINATLNLPSSPSLALRDRRSDFFLFSKCWSGAPSVGYRPTGEWVTGGAPLDLATAMAISGAAVSPRMGLGSVPSLSALLTLLNIRLGYWIANPRRRVKGSPGFLCLLREMTGTGMSESSTWLNLSDGGHIENLGVYELLRRRCKFIVCVDGEADPQSTFEGQITLVRHAQIDFGVRIEPRLDDIRPDPRSRFSRTHAHLFRIYYPDAGPGHPAALGLMLYLKLSLTGDEAELLKRYRAIHPDFPHQSTLDQFYDEEQFEAYRQLGVHVAEGTFAPALLTQDQHPANVATWFRQLAGNMLEPSRT